MGEDLTGRKFGALTAVRKVDGYKNENKMWLCKCDCGQPNCKKWVVMRRGNLTRRTGWMLTCGTRGVNAVQSARTKLVNGVVQSNSRTGIPGVNHSCKYPGMYRARMCINGRRLTSDNLTFDEAVKKRKMWENEVKVGIV